MMSSILQNKRQLIPKSGFVPQLLDAVQRPELVALCGQYRFYWAGGDRCPCYTPTTAKIVPEWDN